jgi:predicted DNA-binding antitoxin AbrB/MazE fold protein
MIGRTFRASFRKGRLEPREPLEFKEGTELLVTVEEVEEGGTIPEPRNIWAGYNPDEVIAALKESAGALADVDRERLLADIHEARAQHGPGRS